MPPQLQLLAERLRVSDRAVAGFLHRYRLDEPIAEGEMGVLFGAEDIEAGTSVVIKFPNPAPDEPFGCDLEERVEALQYEGEWLGAANAAGVPRVVRMVHDGSRESLPFLALERLEGPSLSDALEENAYYAKEAVLFLCQSAETLARLHRIGLLHYDIKPGNFVGNGTEWILIDPAEPEYETHEYMASGLTSGPLRDVVALGRTVLAMERGAEGEERVPDDSEFAEDPSLVRLLNEMLRESGSQRPVPTADEVHRRAKRAAKRCFSDDG